MWGWLARALDAPPPFAAVVEATQSARGAVAAVDAHLADTALSSLVAAVAALATLEGTVATVDASDLARIRAAVDEVRARLERYRQVVTEARRLKERSIERAWLPGEGHAPVIRSARRPPS